MTNATIKLDSKVRGIAFDVENNTEKAIKIWYGKLSPIERITLRNKIGADKYSQISRMYRAYINYIADNLQEFE